VSNLFIENLTRFSTLIIELSLSVFILIYLLFIYYLSYIILYLT